jgi:DNA-binding CsgD family transcriptional regulator
MGLFGRALELGTLTTAIAKAENGEGAQVAVVRGEAGIGKTTLLHEAAREASGTVLRLSGVDSDVGLAFGGLVSLVRPHLAIIDELSEYSQVALRTALGLAPPAMFDRLSVASATLQFLARMAEEKPLLLVVDDLHWLDQASREALLFAVRRLVDDRVTVLFGLRPGYDIDISRFQIVELDGLTPNDGEQLLKEHAAISSDVARSIVDRCSGNPLSLREVGARLTERQRRGLDPLGDRLPIGPATLELFRQPLGLLSDGERFALLVAALTDDGDRTTIDTAVGSHPNWQVAEDLRLVAIEPRCISFVHPLVRSAVVEVSGESEKRRAYLALAAAETDPTRAMWFRALGSSGPDEELAAGLELRAMMTMGQSDPAFARVIANRAAALSPTAPAAARRHLLAAQASLLAGLDHTKHVDRAVQHGDDATKAEAYIVAAAAGSWLSGPESLEHLINRILPEVIKSNRTAGAIISAFCSVDTWKRLRIDQMKSLADTSWELADHQIALPHLFGIMPALATAYYPELTDGLNPVPGLLEQCAEAIEAQGLGEFAAIIALAHMIHGRHADAVAYAMRLNATATERGSVTGATWLAVVLGMAHHRLGQLDAALQWATHANDLAGVIAGGDFARSQALAELATVGIVRGDFDIALAQLDLVDAIGRTTAIGPSGEVARYARGLHLALAGQLAEAVEVLGAQPTLDGGVAEFFPHLYELVECLVRLDRVEEARALKPRLDRIAAHPRLAHRGQLLRCAGLVADDDAYDEPFEASIAEFERLGRILERARTELVYGERLRRSGRLRQARAQLTNALAAFTEQRCAPWIDRTRSELQEAGGSAAQPVARPDELTPQERNVVMAVVSGQSNRDAAASLFLSPKTIESHLTRIYRKFGVKSRNELMALLASRDSGSPATPARG